MGRVLVQTAVPQGFHMHGGHLEGQLAQLQLVTMPVVDTKWRGSTVSRSELTTTRPAVKNWLTVSTMRRWRPIEASASSTKPYGRPEKLTSICRAAQ